MGSRRPWRNESGSREALSVAGAGTKGRTSLEHYAEMRGRPRYVGSRRESEWDVARDNECEGLCMLSVCLASCDRSGARTRAGTFRPSSRSVGTKPPHRLWEREKAERERESVNFVFRVRVLDRRSRSFLVKRVPRLTSFCLLVLFATLLRQRAALKTGSEVLIGLEQDPSDENGNLLSQGEFVEMRRLRGSL